jgi:hypothetical protein
MGSSFQFKSGVGIPWRRTRFTFTLTFALIFTITLKLAVDE